MTDHVLQAAVCQFAATTDIAENTASCVDLIERAARAGAELAVLPEAAMFFDPGRTVPGTHGQPTDGPFVQHIAAAAAKAGIAVVVGMSESIDDPDRDSNTVVALSATGDLLGAYRKIHLYDAFGFKESDNVRPADIDRHHPGRAVLKQAIGEAAGRSAEIQAGTPANVDGKRIERALELQPAARDVSLWFRHLERGVLGQHLRGLHENQRPRAHAPGGNQPLRLFA